jgi:hypothetical protein
VTGVIYVNGHGSTRISEVSELRPSSGFLNTTNTIFRELHLFPSSGEGRQTPTLLGLVTEVSSVYGNQ